MTDGKKIEERIELLERDLEDTQKMLSLVVAVILGKHMVSGEQFHLLRRLLFFHEPGEPRGVAAETTALKIEYEAEEFIRSMEGSKFPGMLTENENDAEARLYWSIQGDPDGVWDGRRGGATG